MTDRFTYIDMNCRGQVIVRVFGRHIYGFRNEHSRFRESARRRRDVAGEKQHCVIVGKGSQQLVGDLHRVVEPAIGQVLATEFQLGVGIHGGRICSGMAEQSR